MTGRSDVEMRPLVLQGDSHLILVIFQIPVSSTEVSDFESRLNRSEKVRKNWFSTLGLLMKRLAMKINSSRGWSVSQARPVQAAATVLGVAGARTGDSGIWTPRGRGLLRGRRLNQTLTQNMKIEPSLKASSLLRLSEKKGLGHSWWCTIKTRMH
jgi:hypothetical protein